jgi:glycosyltransferase involved in cell wall biosynthesis
MYLKKLDLGEGILERVFVVREGVDGVFKPKENKKVNKPFRFIMIGRFEYRKASKEQIQAFLEEFKDDDVELHIQVDNQFTAYGKVLTTEERLKIFGFESPKIKVVHFLPSDEYLKFIQNADCLLACHRAEGWGLPISEAIACGIPVIVPDTGAHLEYSSEIGNMVKTKGMLPIKDCLTAPN